MHTGVDARGYCRKLWPCPQNVVGTQYDFPTDGCVQEFGSYPVEAQFQQSNGAWSAPLQQCLQCPFWLKLKSELQL
jgi:hypothetical protein